MSLHKPHADKQGFYNDYVRLAGLNTITGGAGADFLTGGAGKDTFLYTSGVAGAAETGDFLRGTIDIITDFDSGVNGDKIGGFGVAGTESNTVSIGSRATYNDAFSIAFLW